MPTWNGRYVLRRIVEDDPLWHRIYKDSDRPDDITSADNFFSKEPNLASKSHFEAVRVDPPPAWSVTLQGNPNATMGIFRLRSLP